MRVGLALVCVCGLLGGCSAGSNKASSVSAPPTAVAGGPYSGTAGTAVSFTAAGSSDPQGQTLTYAWSFGDSSTGTTATPTHTYAATGTYTVSLMVTDTSGLTGTAASKATIAAAPLPPVVNAGGPYTGTAGTAVNFSSAGSSDPQGQTLTYAWNFGDSSTGTGAAPTHTYATAGTYTVSLTVTDTSGLTGTATSKTTVGLAPQPGVAISGTVMSGTQTIAGSHVYLLAANTTGYGGSGIAASSSNSSISLLSPALTGSSDSLGAYVVAGSNGGFSLAGDYNCISGQEMYLYATGGNAGNGNNSSIGMMAAIGGCQTAPAPPIVAVVNEISTVATAYSLAGFATDATHVSSSATPLALTGLTNAFGTVARLETLGTGTSNYNFNGANYPFQLQMDTVADILSTCVRSSGAIAGPPSATPCYSLFSNALSGGSTGTTPIETATATINIAHFPSANVGSLFALMGNMPPYTPTLAFLDYSGFVIGISYDMFAGFSGDFLAVDAAGNVWTTCDAASYVSNTVYSVAELTSTGVTHNFVGNGLNTPSRIAVDQNGNVWVSNFSANSLSEFLNSGQAAPGSPFTTGFSGPSGLAIDANNSVWISNANGNFISKLTSAGSAVTGSPFNGGGLSSPGDPAVDASGNLWVPNVASTSATILTSAGTPLSNSPFPSVGTQPLAVVIDHSGNGWFVTPSTGQITEYSPGGTLLLRSAIIPNSRNIAFDGSGNFWAIDSTTPASYGLVAKFSPSVVESTKADAPTSGSTVAVDGSGNVWATQFNGLVEYVGAATPVVTPIAANLAAPYSAAASRP